MTDSERTGTLQRDIERIEALRDQGRLSDEEAQRLIAVLRGDVPVDGDPDDEALRDVGAEAGRVAGAVSGAFASAATSASSGQAAAAPSDDLGISWLSAEMVAADLVIDSVAGASEPRLRQPVEDVMLEPRGAGWRLRYRSERSSWTFFGLDRTPKRIELELPAGMGVELAVKAGDVRLQGVTHVRGRMLAGDLHIAGAEYVDIDKKAGDLQVAMRATSGTQRLIAKAGDVDVTLEPGSDVRVSADVKVGDLRVDGAALQGERSSKGVGHRYVGRVGAGSAELTVRLTAGSLRLRS